MRKVKSRFLIRATLQVQHSFFPPAPFYARISWLQIDMILAAAPEEGRNTELWKLNLILTLIAVKGIKRVSPQHHQILFSKVQRFKTPYY